MLFAFFEEVEDDRDRVEIWLSVDMLRSSSLSLVVGRCKLERCIVRYHVLRTVLRQYYRIRVVYDLARQQE